MIDKLQGKKLASQFVSYVLENEIDMKQTVEAYEAIVKANLEQDPTNEVLQDLDKNARIKFVQALDKVSIERVKRMNKQILEMQKQSQEVLSKVAKLRIKCGQTSKYNKMIAEKNDEEKKQK